MRSVWFAALLTACWHGGARTLRTSRHAATVRILAIRHQRELDYPDD